VAIRLGFWPPCIERLGTGRYDPAMAKVQYESKDDGGHRFWTARYGRYAIRIDANRPGLYR
jgi:hypothetical protein